MIIWGLIGAFGLLAVAIYGLLVLRNLIKLTIAVQLMMKGALIAVVLAGVATGQRALGESLGVTLVVADTVAAVIGLALAVLVRRRMGSLDIETLSKLRG